MPKPIIIGIDPGTTSAYAILDLNGNILKIQSKKDFGFNEMVKKVSEIGLPIILGTDKQKIPDFIERFARKTGAKILNPDHDLKEEEKRTITNGLKHNNSHEMDALASALIAYNTIKPTIEKTRKFTKTNFNEIATYVLRDDIPIKTAISILEAPEEVKEIKKVIQEKQLSKKDYMELFEKYKSMKKENQLLRQHSIALTNKIKKIEPELDKIKTTKSKLTTKKIDTLFQIKEKRLKNFEYKIRDMDERIKELIEEIKHINKAIFKLRDYYVLKKVSNLSLKELSNVVKGDILYVENPNLFTIDSVKEIKDKITIVIHRDKTNSKTEQLVFDFIPADKLTIEEYENFALVKKKDLDKLSNKKDLMHKIIQDYKESRTT